MKRGLTETELEYLDSLISRIDYLKFDFTQASIYDEIKLMKEIYKRKYINTNVEYGRPLGDLLDEAELINSWKQWYIYTTKILKKKTWNINYQNQS